MEGFSPILFFYQPLHHLHTPLPTTPTQSPHMRKNGHILQAHQEIQWAVPLCGPIAGDCNLGLLPEESGGVVDLENGGVTEAGNCGFELSFKH